MHVYTLAHIDTILNQSLQVQINSYIHSENAFSTVVVHTGGRPVLERSRTCSILAFCSIPEQHGSVRARSTISKNGSRNVRNRSIAVV